MSRSAAQPLGPGGALGRRAGRRVAPGDPADRGHHQRRAHQARQHAGGEELADVGLGDDAVDDHDRRRRDHDAQRAAGRDDAGGQVGRIAVPLHLRIGHLGHRRRGGDRRAADRAEAGAGDDGGVGQPAAHMADEGEGSAEQLVRQPGTGDEVAHQDEQRHHAQRVGEAAVVDHLRGAGRGGRPAAQQPQPDIADEAHREGQRQAQQRQQEDRTEAEQRLGHEVGTVVHADVVVCHRRDHQDQMHQRADEQQHAHQVDEPAERQAQLLRLVTVLEHLAGLGPHHPADDRQTGGAEQVDQNALHALDGTRQQRVQRIEDHMLAVQRHQRQAGEDDHHQQQFGQLQRAGDRPGQQLARDHVDQRQHHDAEQRRRRQRAAQPLEQFSHAMLSVCRAGRMVGPGPCPATFRAS